MRDNYCGNFDRKEEVPFSVQVLVSLLNLVWFGFWGFLIFSKGLSPWWFMFPVVFHWSVRDLGNDK